MRSTHKAGKAPARFSHAGDVAKPWCGSKRANPEHGAPQSDARKSPAAGLPPRQAAYRIPGNIPFIDRIIFAIPPFAIIFIIFCV